MDSDEGKIYVGGISWKTDEKLLREYFSHFGEVLDVKVIREKDTGRSKGFGFVVFSDPAVIDWVLQDERQIDNREVDIKRRTSREEQRAKNREVQNSAARSGNLNSSRSFDSGANVRTKEIFVGGLPFSLTLEEFQAYFEQYGAVSDAVIMIDQPTQRPRGFGFVSFDSEDSVDRVLLKTFHDLNGSQVEVQRRKDPNPGVASGGGVAGRFPVYGGSGGSGHRVEVQQSLPKDANPGLASGRRRTVVFLGGGGAGTSSGGGGAEAASGVGGAGAASGAAAGAGARAFPVYGGSGGSGYESHMDSNRYMRPQNTGSSYPPYGAFGYGYAGFGWYGYPTYGASCYGYGSYGVGYGGFDGYGYPAGAPYGKPGVPGASGPRSSRGAQVPSGYGNVGYGNAAPCSAGPGSEVKEQVGGSAVNDSSNGTPSAYGAVDGSSGGYTDASDGNEGNRNHQTNNGQAGSGESHGDGTQAQQ